jgi:N-acetylmuramoyl-L-alanine amidase
MAVLRARGCTVTVSRTRASTVARPRPGDVSGGVSTVRGSHRDVTARDLCAHLVDADVLIGIYLNAGSSPFHAGCLTAYDAVRFVATIAASKVGQEAIAKGLAKAIEQYFGP